MSDREPLLSAVVISRDDEQIIERSVRSVVEQECDFDFEVIVVTSGRDRTAAIVREAFPAVRVVELARPALPGEARNAGLRFARGRYVSFPGSHVVLPPGSLATRVRAHEQGHPMVSGTGLNGTRTWAGWAAYFLDHSDGLPARASGEVSGPPTRCSYRRRLLEEVGGFPEGIRSGEDTIVNRRLWALGHRAYRVRELRFVHRSPCTTPARLLRHWFGRGRGMARTLQAEHRDRGWVLARWALRYQGPALRHPLHVTREVARTGGRLRPLYWAAVPLVLAANTASWLGTWYELLRLGLHRAPGVIGGPATALAVAFERSLPLPRRGGAPGP